MAAGDVNTIKEALYGRGQTGKQVNEGGKEATTGGSAAQVSVGTGNISKESTAAAGVTISTNNGVSETSAQEEVEKTIDTEIKFLEKGGGKVYKKPAYKVDLIIHDAAQYNTSLLRNSKSLEKYIEDPIAFMTNHVWSYSIKNPQDLVFNYKLPDNLFALYSLNSLTNSFIQQSVEYVKNLEPVIPANNKIYTLNYLFKVRFAENVVNYLLANGYTDESLVSYRDEAGGLFSQSYERLFYLWINQIFAFNVEIDDKNRIIFNTDKNSYMPLFLAAYFLLDKIQGGNESTSFLDNYPLLKYNKSGFGYTELFLGSIVEFAKSKKYVNTNNYWYATKERESALDIGAISNYSSSIYFNPSLGTFGKSYISKLSMAKKVKKCVQVKESKKETALELFYKKGNDNILVGDTPKEGLGCDTDLLEWSDAKQIFFDIKSLQKGRVNLKIPYYSVLEASIKNLIPSELGIAKTAGYTRQTLEEFNTLITLNYLNKPLDDIKKLKMLIDQELSVALTDELDQDADWNYFGFKETYGTNGNWGPDAFMKNLVDSTDAVRFQTLAPYLGLYNVGYILEKYSAANELIQEVYVNPANTKGPSKGGYQDGFTYIDSQVKYGKGYGYRLKQLVAFPSISYDYKGATGQKSSDGRFFIEIINKPFKFSNDIKKPSLTTLVENYISIIDLPPKPTFMTVYPKRGKNDRITIVFGEYASSLTAEIVETPKKNWLDGWQDAKDFYIKQVPQNPPLKDEEMIFASLDVEKILLYSVEGKKPTSEQEFTKVVAELDTLFDGYSKELIIKPNTKYYFATRSISYTGLSSYLSEIYSVELVDDGGAVFPLIEIVQLEEEKDLGQEKRHFSSAFRIEPALLQQAPNVAKNRIGYLYPSVFSGGEETRPQFKIRLTSKKTGRKVDFNVIYKKVKTKKSEDVGEISVSQTKKDKVLISYKNVATALEEALASDESVAAKKKSEKLAQEGMNELANALKRQQACEKKGLKYDHSLYKSDPSTGGCKKL